MLGFHGFGDAKIAVKRDCLNRCNWELVVENFLESYHCTPSHPEYCSVHPRDQLLAPGAGPGSGPEEAMEKIMALYPDYGEADFFLKYNIYNHISE